MKSIFTKLSILLLCGMVALVGCTDFSSDLEEVSNRVDANSAEITALKNQISTLKAEFDAKYATKDEVAELAATIAELQTALDTKADAAAVQAAIEELEALIAALAEKHDQDMAGVNEGMAAINAELAILKDELAALKEAIQGLNNYDDTAVKEAIASVSSDLETLKTTLDEYMAAIDESLADITNRLAAIESTIPELQAAIAAVNAAVANKVDNQTFAAAIAKLESAIAGAKYDDTEIKKSLLKLTAQYSALSLELKALEKAVLANSAAIAALQAEILKMKVELDSKYATQEMIKELLDLLAKFKEALESKSEDVIKNAIAQFEEALNALKEKYGENIAAAKDIIEAIKAELEALKNSIDNLPGANIDVDAVKVAIAAIMQQLEQAKDDIVTAITKIVEEITSIKSELPSIQEAIDAINNALSGKVDTEALVALVKELRDEIKAAIKDSAYDDSAIYNEINKIKGQYTLLKGELRALEQLVLANSAAIAKLQIEILKLKAEMDDKYVSQDMIKALIDAMIKFKDELADKSKDAIEAAIAQFEQVLKEIEEKYADKVSIAKEVIDAIKAEIEELKKAIDNLPDNNVDIEIEIEVELEKIIGKISGLISKLEQYKDDIKAAIEKTINDIKEIKASIPELQDAIDAINDALATKADKEAMDAAVKEFNEQINKLRDEIAASKYDDSKLLDEINKLNDAISSLNSDYAGLKAELEDLKNQLDILKSELRGIVMVPQTMVDGKNAIEFKSFAYVPMSADSDEIPAVGGAGTKKISSAAYAYYHFNPSNFRIDDATYSIVSTKVQTKAASEPAVEINSIAKKGDKVEVLLTRTNSTDNMFALAATLKSTGATIYSDYTVIIDNNVVASDIQLVKNNGEAAYTTLVDAEAGNADIETESDKNVTLNGYIKAEGIDAARYGLSFVYTLVYGNVAVAQDGALDMTNASGVSIVKADLVNSKGEVVRRAYVKLNVTKVEAPVPGIYYYATATASVEAERVVFEVKDIYNWAKALKDMPNTCETIKNAVTAVKEKDYMTAYELLGGVPGFVKKFNTFTGFGEYEVRVDALPEISDATDLKGVLEDLKAKFNEEDIAGQLGNLYDYVPENIKSNPFISALINKLKNYNVSDLLENETVLNLIESAEAAADKFGLDVIDYDALTNKLNELVGKVSDKIEGSEMTAAAASKAAEAGASALAIKDLEANINAANAEIEANFQNGTWGQMAALLDNEIVKAAFEKLQLEEAYNALKTVSEYGTELAQYRHNPAEIKVAVEPAVKIEK